MLDILNCNSWQLLVFQIWRGYVWFNGVVCAAKLGFAGLKMGYGLGRVLVEEQKAVISNTLSVVSRFLGSPYAELLWCQVLGALIVGMAAEMMYTSLLGLVLGGCYGFFSGYYQAVCYSTRVAGGLIGRVARCGLQAARRGLAFLSGGGLGVPRRRHRVWGIQLPW